MYQLAAYVLLDLNWFILRPPINLDRLILFLNILGENFVLLLNSDNFVISSTPSLCNLCKMLLFSDILCYSTTRQFFVTFHYKQDRIPVGCVPPAH